MNNIPSVVTRSKKRVGRGVGSGKGFHTTGRGQKGQKARYSVGILFEGVKTKKSLLHRLPMLAGKGKFKARPKKAVITIADIETLPAGDITVEALVKGGIITMAGAKHGVKILGTGKVTKKFVVKVPASQSVREAVTSAGGTIA